MILMLGVLSSFCIFPDATRVNPNISLIGISVVSRKYLFYLISLDGIENSLNCINLIMVVKNIFYLFLQHRTEMIEVSMIMVCTIML